MSLQKRDWDAVANDVDFNLEIDVSMIGKLVQKEAVILDYGCGYGRNSEILNLMGYRNIVGVDSSPEMIHRGRLMYPHLSLSQNKSIKIDYPNEYPKDEPMRRCPNIDKYYEEFKKKPKINLKTGLYNFYQ